MLSKQIIQYCEGNFQSSAQILKKIFEYKKFLLSENLKMNLIGKSTIDDFDQRHLLDCIQIHKFISPYYKAIGDLGSGAGLPGLLLSILGFKNIHLIEKSSKKSQFLNNCKMRLGLNINIHNCLIEEIKSINFDTIVARAFAPINKVIVLTKNITNPKTKFILLKGKTYLSELESIDSKTYEWETHSSITSKEARIIDMKLK